MDPLKILIPLSESSNVYQLFEYASFLSKGLEVELSSLYLYESKDPSKVKSRIIEIWHTVRSKTGLSMDLIVDIQSNTDRNYECIINYACSHDIGLIVMSSDTSFKEFAETDTYKVALGTPCPILTVNHDVVATEFRNILVPFDLGDGAINALPFAKFLAKRFDATIHLLAASENKEDLEELDYLIEEFYQKLLDSKVKVKVVEIMSTHLPEAIKKYEKKSEIDLILTMSRPAFRKSDRWLSPKAKKIITLSNSPVISISPNG